MFVNFALIGFDRCVSEDEARSLFAAFLILSVLATVTSTSDIDSTGSTQAFLDLHVSDAARDTFALAINRTNNNPNSRFVNHLMQSYPFLL